MRVGIAVPAGMLLEIEVQMRNAVRAGIAMHMKILMRVGIAVCAGVALQVVPVGVTP